MVFLAVLAYYHRTVIFQSEKHSSVVEPVLILVDPAFDPLVALFYDAFLGLRY